ncbi:DNA replication protein psf1 [Nowakowskiella sp. JEL0078]|nr:DNA replication protein psf1 [Nowakowskiella sp. JEL0078]
MSGFAEEATKLVRQCKRAESFYATSHSMLPFDDSGVQNVISEIRSLSSDIQRKLRTREVNPPSTLESNGNSSQTLDLSQLSTSTNTTNSKNSTVVASEAATVLISHMALHRNKRGLLLYLRHRADRIMDLVWENGALDLLPQTSGAVGAERALLSPPEQEFMKDYMGLVTAYKGRFMDIDLGAALVPPKDVFVTVRVVKDGCGEVQTISGPVRLTKNSQHYLRRTDIEHLITRGFLQHVD